MVAGRAEGILRACLAEERFFAALRMTWLSYVAMLRESLWPSRREDRNSTLASCAEVIVSVGEKKERFSRSE